MTHASLRTIAIALAIGATAFANVLGSTTAEAGSGKEFFSETYTFDRATNGYEGRAGDYYCSYIKTPVRKCDKSGFNCKVVAWQLQQHCQ